MTQHLIAKFAPAFSRDLKKKAAKRQWDLKQLESVIDLVMENTPEAQEILRQRHNMHRLSGEWGGSNECHVANAGDWLVIWRQSPRIGTKNATSCSRCDTVDTAIRPRAGHRASSCSLRLKSICQHENSLEGALVGAS